ncbi:hypothetical protein KAU11_05235 [Candidatus Babeliales bacterium]|nr:hypothetical protein [Candidatus Babeliales bacterium]
MALWIKFTLAVLGLVGMGFGLVIWFGSVHWNGKTSQFVEKLIQTSPRRNVKKVSFKDIEQLPAPVVKYFQLVLKEGQPLIRTAYIVQTGEFRSQISDNGWGPFEAKQCFSALSPGFVWDASISMTPLMKVRVRDAYIAGHGSMQVKIFALVSLVDERGKAELNAGALQRYLAEAVWFPTALLPSEGVKWSAIDNSRALATLTDFGTTVSLEFHFNDVGEITSVFTPGRYREVNGKYELTPWAGYFSNYEERDGMRIPVEGNVEWQLPGENLPYWKGRIIKVKYDFSR